MARPPASAATISAFRALSTEADVAAFFGFSVKALRFHLYSTRRAQYRRFDLTKKSGGFRSIEAPPNTILKLQQKLASVLTPIYRPKSSVHGFTKDRSVLTNAECHAAKTLVLNVDIEDFFPTINFGRVRGIFAAYPFAFPQVVSTILAQICCSNGRLPQGGAVSPVLANLACRSLDNELSRLAKRHRCEYTRYADDVTFSTEAPQFSRAIVEEIPTGFSRLPKLGVELEALFAKNQFRINPKKTRLQIRSERQEVTGLTVNSFPNVQRQYVRNIRSILHDIQSNGLAASQLRFVGQFDARNRSNGVPRLEEHIAGKIEYLRMVKGSDDPVYVRLLNKSAPVLKRRPWTVKI